MSKYEHTQEIKKTIWGRELDISLNFAGFSDISDKQISAYENFDSKFDSMMEDAKKAIIEYCFSEYKDYFEQHNVNAIDNIFKYVVPVVIHVTQDFRDNRIGLICKFKCDIENGLCAVFKDGKIENVGYDYVVL